MSELEVTKYKYNELMDIVHSDSNKDREFIKRLMKHKRMELNEGRKENEEEEVVVEEMRGNKRNNVGNNNRPSSSSMHRQHSNTHTINKINNQQQQ